MVAIYAALALGLDKMAFETGITPHLFGAACALLGIALAWGIVKLAATVRNPRSRTADSRT